MISGGQLLEGHVVAEFLPDPYKLQVGARGGDDLVDLAMLPAKLRAGGTMATRLAPRILMQADFGFVAAGSGLLVTIDSTFARCPSPGR